MISLKILSLLEGFKEVEAKFSQVNDPVRVKEYISKFKDASTKNKIKDLSDKNIDSWGKKSFEDFIKFLDKLDSSFTSNDLKKISKGKKEVTTVKVDGAKLVASNDSYDVYHITTKEAACVLGTPEWCISRTDQTHYEDYIDSGVNFYFCLSNSLPKEDPLYKVAIAVYPEFLNQIEYFDALDRKIDEPDNIPEFEMEYGKQKVKIDGKYYNMDEPETWPKHIEGDLILSNTKITELPDNLTVGGYLDLRNTKITKLPNNLKVGGDLNLRNTSITESPNNFSVGGDLDLSNTKITKLPNNLKVGENLYLSNTKITSLPDNLSVGRDLYLSNTEITKLPDNLTVGGGLYLRSTPIKELPNNLTVGVGLYLNNTDITELPNNLKVGGDLDLNHTKITELPDGLTVGGNLYLPDGFDLSKVPDHLKDKVRK